ncbi:MAG: hypothetical protein ACM3WV_01765 [Bacillota bacterium]
MKRILYIPVLTVLILFLFAAHAGAAIKAALITELKGGLNAKVYYGDYDYSAWGDFRMDGFRVELETTSYGGEICWGSDESGFQRMWEIRVKTPAIPGIPARLYAGMGNAEWDNVYTFYDDEPAHSSLFEMNLGLEYQKTLTDSDLAKLGFAIDLFAPLLAVLSLGDRAFGGYQAYPSGDYSLWGFGFGAALSLELKLTPQTNFFASAQYDLRSYWYGSFINFIIWGIDGMNDYIDITYEYLPGAPYVRTEFARCVMGLRYAF